VFYHEKRLFESLKFIFVSLLLNGMDYCTNH